MKTKFFNTAAAIILALVVFAAGGCKRSGSSGVPTLIWWQIGSTQPGFADDMKVINSYIQEKIGIRVDIRQASWGEAYNRFNTMLNAGEYFDILFVDEGTYNRFASKGAFADITDLVKTEAPLLWESVPPILWEGVKIRGRIFSVPTYKDSSRTGYYYWDHQLVEKYNIDLNQSGWNYLDQVFRRIKAGEGPRSYPFTLARTSNPWIFDNYDAMLTALFPMGVRIDDPERKVVITLEQPDIRETLKLMHSWYEAGIINPDANLVAETPKGRRFFMAQAWPSVAAIYAAQEGIERFDPVRFYGPIYSTVSIQGSMNAVNLNSKYKAEALKLLQLINTDTKLRDMLCYGIEGKHFNYVNNGKAVQRIIVDWSLVNYQQGNYFIITPQADVPPGYWDEVRHQNETATSSVMLGFMMDVEPVLNDLTNCRTAWDKYAVDLMNGVSDPDVVLPKVIAELKANGLDRVMAEAQRQVDEFSRQR